MSSPAPPGKGLKGPDRVRVALAERGLELVVKTLPGSTRTAKDAAAAVGCELGEIAKSLVFRRVESGDPLLVVASGANRVDTQRLADLVGEAVEMADAAFVRRESGFAIGGVPPFGHVKALPTLLDEDLFRYRKVWAAAGGPFSLFRITPGELEEVTGAPRAKVAS